MSKTARFVSFVTPFIGAIFHSAKENADFRLAKLSDKLGSLKDGSKGQYVVLEKTDDTGTTIELHPANLDRLLKNGEDDEYKIVSTPEGTAIGTAPSEAPAVEPAETSAASTAEAAPATETSTEAAPAAAEGSVAPTEASPAATDGAALVEKATAAKKKAKKEGEADAPAEPKAPSKKDLAKALYTKMVAEGKARKDVIEAMKTEIGLTQAGANTYYQNIKSGAWK